MKKNSALAAPSAASTAVLLVLFAAVNLLFYAGTFKVLTLLAGLAAVYVLLRRDVRAVQSVPALMLLGYVVITGIGLFWALSGKFFLQEYSKVFASTALLLAIVCKRDFAVGHAKQIMTVVAGTGALYSVLSVEAATTEISRALFKLFLPAMADVAMGFEEGTRLTGIFGNANVSASVLAVSILFSVALLCDAQSKKERSLYAALLSLNAFAFLLSFSMGGIACFVLAVLAYLLFSGKNWISSLIHMLLAALPTLVFAFVAFPFFNSDMTVIPLAAMAVNTLVVVLLELKPALALTAFFEGKRKLSLAMLILLFALVIGYVLLGYNLSGAYTFDGSTLHRSAYPQPGQVSLSVVADGEVKVTVTTQNMSEVMMHTDTVLYKGAADGASFTVPEDSEVCYFDFSADSGTTISEAVLSTGEALKLNYTLLPGFIANRIQGLWANQNAIQRTVFFEDGMKLFSRSPILGNGMGSFESGITSVQQFYYETKYAHNHYIQILLESGVVGLALFVGAMGAMLLALLKKFKEEDWQFRPLYAALWGSMIMILTHAAVEVSMSVSVFLSCAFVTFALVIRCTAKESDDGGKSLLQKQSVKAVLALLPLVFSIAIACNMAANTLRTQSVRSVDEYFNNVSLSVTLDAFEKNDAKLSYVMNALNEGDESKYPQANEYAEELMKVHSNSVPRYLVQYYLGTGQYEQALQAANAGAQYSASDAYTWNYIISVFHDTFLSGIFSPMLSDPAPVIDGSLAYYDTLQRRNQENMENIELEMTSIDFFAKMKAFSDTNCSAGEVLDIMLEHLFLLKNGCDADCDSINDQITSYKKAAFNPDGSVKLEKDGKLTLAVITGESFNGIHFVVDCEDPGSLTLKETSTGQSVTPSVSNGQVVFDAIIEAPDGYELSFTLTSSAQQTITDAVMTRLAE